jgi:hypothetical protein
MESDNLLAHEPPPANPGGIAMSEPNQTDEFFKTLASVLLLCWIFGVVVLLFWWGSITLVADLTLGIHGDMFGVPRPHLNVIHYCGLMLTKVVIAHRILFRRGHCGRPTKRADAQARVRRFREVAPPP